MITISEFNKYRAQNKSNAIPCKQGLALGVRVGTQNKVQFALFLMELRDHKYD
ncbi:hypothetical protein VIOR103205_09055 [Vibrio ordalii]|uniref:hypothetical protein n=1 Tax=Vibrio ordalii TaxID=28174 RepID=UPI0002E2784F|nr:hypothetical protein [Vibrio ordalii]